MESCSRDPIGYRDNANLCGNYFGLTFLDPTGLWRQEVDCEEYFEYFLKLRPHLKKHFPDCKEHFYRGCVGVAIINIGEHFGGSPDTSRCFSTREEALKFKSTWICDDSGEDPVMFSIHFWWNGKLQKRKNGTVNLGPWERGGRIPKPGTDIGFDFGYCHSTNKILHANHCHPSVNPPERGGENIGPMKVYISSLAEWEESYSNFNQKVWCIACQKKFAQPVDPYWPNIKPVFPSRFSR